METPQFDWTIQQAVLPDGKRCHTWVLLYKDGNQIAQRAWQGTTINEGAFMARVFITSQLALHRAAEGDDQSQSPDDEDQLPLPF